MISYNHSRGKNGGKTKLCNDHDKFKRARDSLSLQECNESINHNKTRDGYSSHQGLVVDIINLPVVVP